MTCPECGNDIYGKFLINDIELDDGIALLPCYGTCKHCNKTFEWTIFVDANFIFVDYSPLKEFKYC